MSQIIKKAIATSAIAEEGKIYPVLQDGLQIGTVEFLVKNEKEEFEFETDYDNAENYDYMFDLDKDSNELIRLRVQDTAIYKQN